MRSVRVHRARHAIRRITALVALVVSDPHTSSQSARLSVNREPVVAVARPAQGVAPGIAQPDGRLMLMLRVESGEPRAGSCVATVTIVTPERVAPDTALTTLKTAEARRQRRTRLLEWGIQALRVLDAILQATRALLR
jgi:hypothetical protein